jgi:hypothetical protein
MKINYGKGREREGKEREGKEREGKERELYSMNII